MINTTRPAIDTHMLGTSVPGPDGVVFAVNAFYLPGVEPTLVDAGLSPQTEQFRAALWNLVDPADLRWIVVTHDDRDHTGSLRAILHEAPNATVVTNFISMVKIGEDWQLPLHRLRLINSGDRLEIGDEALDVFRPPTYDSPGTLAFHALRRDVLFSSDCMGAFLPSLAEAAEAIPAADYRAGAMMFASAMCPWLPDVDPGRWRARVADLRRRSPAVVLSTHGLPLTSGLEGLLTATADLPTGQAFSPPGQEFVEAMLAMSAGAGAGSA
jgi:glyoxylase-like metal-dependent hydrolase (beta-lactamase superfamily II)